MALGPHKIEYEVLEGWDQLPEGYRYIEVAGVGCDSQDRVYVFNRGEYPMIVFDKEGKFLNAWGKGVFNNPHGIFIDRKDNLWLADDKEAAGRLFERIAVKTASHAVVEIPWLIPDTYRMRAASMAC